MKRPVSCSSMKLTMLHVKSMNHRIGENFVMHDQPLVSVFMPTYNHEKFIAEAIESVLNQDYDNLEIVICDDASTDSTAQIVRAYAEKHPKKIKPIYNPKNLGITPTCNVTLKQCTGKYIAFFSGDDLFLPGKIRKQVEVMEKDDSVILCYHAVEVFNSGTNETAGYWKNSSAVMSTVSLTTSAVVKDIIPPNNSIHPLSFMVKGDKIPERGFNERIPLGSDSFMFIRILAESDCNTKVVYLPDVLARYRHHDSNITKTKRTECHEDIFVTLALTESRFPWLIDATRKGRSEMNYKRGIQLIRSGEVKVGRKLLNASFFDKWHSPRWFRWYLASYMAQTGVVRKLIKG